MPVGQPRLFGFDADRVQHCPICLVAWNIEALRKCWIDPDHPVSPGIFQYP